MQKRKVPFTVSTSLKSETRCHEHSSFPVSSSLKNEINPLLIKSSLSYDLVNEPSFHPAINYQMCTWLNEMKLGGHKLQQLRLGGIKHNFLSVSSLCKNETTLKHSFSLFQAFVKMKPILSQFWLFSRLVKLMKIQRLFCYISFL